MSSDYYRPPVSHALEKESFLVPMAGGARLIVRTAYYGRRLLVDFAIQLEVHESSSWIEAARVDCCKGVIHRHQFARSSGEDLIDHKPWALIPVGVSRQAVDSLLWQGYDWAYQMLYEQAAELIRRWRNE